VTVEADTALAILAVLLQTLPDTPSLVYDHEAGCYRMFYGPDGLSYLKGATLTELTDRGR
jgi:hypothetical protein